MGFYVREKKSPSMHSKLIILVAIFLLYPTNFAFAQEDDEVVILYTKSGKMVIEFFLDDAPDHVDNFKKLVDNRTYYQTIFHRVIKDFMIQGGDPLTKPEAYDTQEQWGTGNPGFTIPAEFNDIKHNRGIVSMARSAHPDSAGSQFFIVHKDSNFLDGQYTVFGRLITQESYDTLDKIANLEIGAKDIPKNWGETEIVDTEIVKRSEIPDLLDLGEPERTGTQTPQLLSEEVTSNVNDTTPEGGGCLIATATFGSELAPQVQQLREIRDSTLLQTNSGTAFMIGFSQLYYSFSPTIADLERENAVFKEAIKIAITPMILSLSILNHVEIDSEEEMLGYGISVILLNIGMYFVAPAILFLKLRKTY